MTDLYEDICAPESCLSERFMLKLKAHLAKPYGVFGVNTLPPYFTNYFLLFYYLLCFYLLALIEGGGRGRSPPLLQETNRAQPE
jgi:hypothetical protein